MALIFFVSRLKPIFFNRRSIFRLLAFTALSCCCLMGLQAYIVEPFQVPSGSMAPTLLGQHRQVTCPRCGLAVAVGRLNWDREGTAGQRHYVKCCCPNCGQQGLPAGLVAETLGDQVRVDKLAYQFRGPRRWEVVVVRRGGRFIIKRIAGLPGEKLLIEDGDVFIDGVLARKTLDEAQAQSILFFDQDHAPTSGWSDRWDGASADTGDLIVDGRTGLGRGAYRNFNLDAKKCEPLVDEYAYNGGLHAEPAFVHDFLVTLDLEVVEGEGACSLALQDGADWVGVTLPIERPGLVEVANEAGRLLQQGSQPHVLKKGRTYHVEAALVDRRFSVRINGHVMTTPVDLPPARQRLSVTRPFKVEARATILKMRHVRLWRDVHYRQEGDQGVHGRPVNLGNDEVFILGDNSPRSEDSRFWKEPVARSSLVGLALPKTE